MAEETRSQQNDLTERRRQQELGGAREGQSGLSRWEPAGASLWSGGPFGFMRRMMEEMDRMFDDIGFGGGTSGSSELFRAGERAWTPRVDVRRRDDTLVVRADLPGVKQQDVHVEIEGGMLTLRGERREEREQREGKAHRTECVYGSFVRTIPLPEGVDPEHAKANFADGVLEVTMPAPERRGRRIEVTSGHPEGSGGATTH